MSAVSSSELSSAQDAPGFQWLSLSSKTKANPRPAARSWPVREADGPGWHLALDNNDIITLSLCMRPDNLLQQTRTRAVAVHLCRCDLRCASGHPRWTNAALAKTDHIDDQCPSDNDYG